MKPNYKCKEVSKYIDQYETLFKQSKVIIVSIIVIIIMKLTDLYKIRLQFHHPEQSDFVPETFCKIFDPVRLLFLSPKIYKQCYI